MTVRGILENTVKDRVLQITLIFFAVLDIVIGFWLYLTFHEIIPIIPFFAVLFYFFPILLVIQASVVFWVAYEYVISFKPEEEQTD